MNATNETSATKLTRETLESVTDLAKKVVDTQLRLTQEYMEATRAVLAGDADRVAAGRTFFESVQRETETYLSRISELGVAFSSGVLDLGDQVTHTVLDDVTKAAAHKDAKTATTAKKAAASRTSKSTA